jgi:hypothetical protein
MYEGESTIWEQRMGREENNIKNGLKMYTGFIWLRTYSRNWQL